MSRVAVIYCPTLPEKALWLPGLSLVGGWTGSAPAPVLFRGRNVLFQDGRRERHHKGSAIKMVMPLPDPPDSAHIRPW